MSTCVDGSGMALLNRLRDAAPRSILAGMLDQGEAAAYLGMPQTTLSGWRRRAFGPKGYLHKCHVLYKITDLDAWKAGQA